MKAVANWLRVMDSLMPASVGLPGPPWRVEAYRRGLGRVSGRSEGWLTLQLPGHLEDREVVPVRVAEPGDLVIVRARDVVDRLDLRRVVVLELHATALERLQGLLEVRDSEDTDGVVGLGRRPRVQ